MSDIEWTEATWNPVVGWGIVGGESGPHARRCEAAWMRRAVTDMRAAGVTPFVKQLGLRFEDRTPPAGQPRVGAGAKSRPTDGADIRRLKNRKGADMAEWPVDLRVREWPAAMLAKRVA